MTTHRLATKSGLAIAAVVLAACLGTTSCTVPQEPEPVTPAPNSSTETAPEPVPKPVPEPPVPEPPVVEPPVAEPPVPEPPVVEPPAPESQVAEPPAPEYATFAGSAWGITFEFDYPSAWTVSVTPDSNRSSFTVLDERGDQVGGLTIQPAIGFNCPPTGCENFPLLQLDEVASGEGLVDGEPFAVRTVAMDLSSEPERVRQSGWGDNVRLVTAVSGRTAPPPTETDPNGIYDFESVGLGAEAEGQIAGIIGFRNVKDFPDLRTAVGYLEIEQYQRTQEMLRSFSARACTGDPAEPRSFTGPDSNSIPDLCAPDATATEGGS